MLSTLYAARNIFTTNATVDVLWRAGFESQRLMCLMTIDCSNNLVPVCLPSFPEVHDEDDSVSIVVKNDRLLGRSCTNHTQWLFCCDMKCCHKYLNLHFTGSV